MMAYNPDSIKQKILEKAKFWKSSIEATKNFTGTSPPSIFVGKAFFPKVYVGILSPPSQQATADLLDSPEKWYQDKASIDQIVGYRGQLIYSRFKSDVHSFKGKLLETVQEVAMSKKPADVEIELRKNPKFQFSFNPITTIIGNPAPMLRARLTENPSVERKVDYLVSDIDVKAVSAVKELYSSKLPVSRIQKIFSAGLLGIQTERKFVPTRWSITAVDDIIGKILLTKVREHQELGEFRLFSNEYLGNHYEILLIPREYQYELIECWTAFGKVEFYSDYEPYWGRKDYAINTHGAFYSGRLAVMEYLNRIKRQATILIVREILPSYEIPLGIWQMRETVRGAFTQPYERFDSLGQAVKRISGKVTVKGNWQFKSKLLKKLKEQRKISEFYK
jgi:hypothetical protein